MAATEAGRRLTEAHRLAQARLGADVARRTVVLWQLLDPANLDATQDRWLQATSRMIQTQQRASAALAGQYLAAYRTAEIGLLPGFVPFLAAGSDLAAILTSLLVTGPIYLRKQMAERTLARATEFAKAASASEAMRHAMSGGRDSIMTTIRGDDRALGWARSTSGTPCSFCALMASRGPVYETEETASFKPHGKCHCEPEPVYHRDAPWPPRAREFHDLYQQVAQGQPDQLNAFRRAYERPQLHTGE